jgi:hypothetical protein
MEVTEYVVTRANSLGELSPCQSTALPPAMRAEAGQSREGEKRRRACERA